ncbi:MAG: hypothetical protein ABIR56_08850 [Polaromonas sp.]
MILEPRKCGGTPYRVKKQAYGVSRRQKAALSPRSHGGTADRLSRKHRTRGGGMELFQRLKESIAWLGGALAALTAICYATGYYSFHAHLTMLGLGRVVDFQHEEMLLEGARFFFAVTAHLLQMVLALGAGLVSLLVVCALLGEIGPLRRGWQRCGEWVSMRRAALKEARPALTSIVLLAALVLLLIAHTNRFFYPLLALGRIDSLLFRTGMVATNDCKSLIPVADIGLKPAVAALLLMQGERCSTVLLGEFRRLLDGYLVLLIAISLSFSFNLSPPVLARSFRIVLAVYGMVYTLLLPIDFGILVRAAVYPVANLEFKGGTVVKGNLMTRNDKNLLLWLPTERKVIWYETGNITTIQVVGQNNLFSHPEGGAR